MILPQCTTWLALLLAATNTVAQTTTSCNPTKKTCPDDPGLSSSTYTHDFTTSGADDDAWNVTAGNVKYTSSGAEFTVAKSGDAPTIQSKWYIFFGRVSFHVKAAPGTGIVSSAILQSSDLDEVDWEWLGGSDYASKVQSNYFSKGDTTTYDRSAWATTSATQTSTRNYTISWTETATTWYVDDVAIRTLTYADAGAGEKYPQTPMNVRIGNWAGGDSGNDPGTIEWAGGETNYADGPFTMYLEKIEVVNENPGSSYSYTDMSGKYKSIKVNDAGDGDKDNKGSSSSSASSVAPSSSASASSSKQSDSSSSSNSSSETTGSATSTPTSPSSNSQALPTGSANASTVGIQAATGLAQRVVGDSLPYLSVAFGAVVLGFGLAF